MKWADAIKYVDRDPKNSAFVNIEDLAEEFDMSVFWGDDEDEVFKSYWVKVWNCTDTWVGSRVLCVRGEPVGVISQHCRKCDREYAWISPELREKARAEIVRMASHRDQDVNILPLDEEISDTYRLEYADQVVNKTALLNGKEVEIQRRPWNKRVPADDLIFVDDGKEVEVIDLEFPIRVKIPTNVA